MWRFSTKSSTACTKAIRARHVFPAYISQLRLLTCICRSLLTLSHTHTFIFVRMRGLAKRKFHYDPSFVQSTAYCIHRSKQHSAHSPSSRSTQAPGHASLSFWSSPPAATPSSLRCRSSRRPYDTDGRCCRSSRGRCVNLYAYALTSLCSKFPHFPAFFLIRTHTRTGDQELHCQNDH